MHLLTADDTKHLDLKVAVSFDYYAALMPYFIYIFMNTSIHYFMITLFMVTNGSFYYITL